MDGEQRTVEKPKRQVPWLLRGESVVASSGLMLAAILLGAVAGVAWWAQRSENQAIRTAEVGQARAVGEILSRGVEGMLTGGELTGARRLVADIGLRHGLAVCRVVMPDGGVLADVDPSKITVRQLPERWEGPGATEAGERGLADGLELVYPVIVPGRGAARLEVAAAFPEAGWGSWEMQAGLGGIGALGMIGLLLTYRRMRGRLRALGAIREALAAASAGERAVAALTVGEGLGAEAVTWNALLGEAEGLRKQLLEERAGQSLRSRRDQRSDLDGACDAMSQGLLLVNDQLRITYANGAAAAFLGAKRDDLVGGEVPAFLEDEKLTEALRGVAAGTARRRMSLEIERRGEGAAGVFRFSIRPVRREDSAAAMIIIEDVTQQRVADRARNAFVAQATHELRTPLTNIRLYVEMAVDEGDADAAVRAKCLNVINQETRRLERIVGDMLSVAEIEAGSLKISRGDVRLEALFHEIEADYQAQAKDKEISLRFELPPKLPVIQGDRDKIVLAIHNLVGNALKYTPAGGEVAVRVTTPGDQLLVEVVDNGIGIKEEETELIFEKFYRAKDRRIANITGTGLGLALARDVVRLHGGDITVQSQMDKGSTFTMTLPATAQAA